MPPFSPTSNKAFVELRVGKTEGILVSHIFLSQKPDPKKKQVMNLDQDMHVCRYFWWMVYELLFMNQLPPPFSRDMGYLFSSSFFDMLCEHVAYLLWVRIFSFLLFFHHAS